VSPNESVILVSLLSTIISMSVADMEEPDSIFPVAAWHPNRLKQSSSEWGSMDALDYYYYCCFLNPTLNMFKEGRKEGGQAMNKRHVVDDSFDQILRFYAFSDV
jgi:hypothetical protein